MIIRNAASMGSYGASWEASGYCGQGNVREVIGSLASRPALVAGGAKGVFEEVDAVLKMVPDAVVFAANDVGMFLPKLDHWCSLHTDKLGLWKAVRWNGVASQEVTKYHATDPRPCVDYLWEGLTPLFCLSGYFAMQIAWLLGCRPIVLCGCPGEPAPRFFEAEARKDFGYGGGHVGSDNGVKEQLIKEMERLPEFKAAVRSMSGFTREFFGGI